MNKVILVAAALMGATTAAHIFGGGPDVFHPLLKVVADPYLNSFVPILWHAITVVLGVFTFALLWLAKHQNRPLEAVLATVQLGFSALFLMYGVTEFGTARMPQWIAFTAIPLLTFIAARRRERAVRWSNPTGDAR